MKPVFQTKLHSETINGNCLAACIASLIECTIEEQPHYEDLENWSSAMRKFLESKGYTFDGTARSYESEGYEGVDGYVIMCGKSPRGEFGHCVIYKDGSIHDPHPSNHRLLTEDYFFLIKKTPINEVV